MISGANEDVSRNRNAACPLGVAILGIFVPVLIAIANLSNWAREMIFISNASLISFI